MRVRVKCLTQEHNTMTQPGLELGPLDRESSELTIRQLCLTQAVSGLRCISKGVAIHVGC